jgi:hypothetical protein
MPQSRRAGTASRRVERGQGTDMTETVTLADAPLGVTLTKLTAELLALKLVVAAVIEPFPNGRERQRIMRSNRCAGQRTWRTPLRPLLYRRSGDPYDAEISDGDPRNGLQACGRARSYSPRHVCMSAGGRIGTASAG